MSATSARRAAKLLLGTLGALVLAVVVLGALAFTTEIGAELAVRAGLSRIGSGAEVGDVSGTLRGPLVLHDVVVRPGSSTVRIDRLVADWKPLQLFDGVAAFERILAEGVEIVVTGGDTGAASSGAPGLAHPLELPVGVSVEELTVSRLMVSAPGFEVVEGEVHATGRAAGYRFSASGDISSGQLTRVPLALSGTGNLRRVQIDTLAAQLLDGRVTASGGIEWQPRIAWSLTAEGRGLDLAVLVADSADWHGDLWARARTSGVLTADGPRGMVRLDSVLGTLRGEPVSGEADLELRPGGYQVPSLALTWGSATLEASGGLTHDLDFTYSLSAPRIGELLPDAAGSLASEGTLRGTRNAPIIDAEIDASDLRLGSISLARATGEIELNLSRDGSSRIDLLVRGLQTAGLRLDRATVTGSGARDRHRVRVIARGDDWRGGLGLVGGFAPDEWRWMGALDSLRLYHEEVGSWALRSTGRLVVAPGSVELAESCIGSDEALVCTRGSWHESTGWRATGHAEKLPLSLASDLLPPEWSIAGQAAAEFSGAMLPGGVLRAAMRVDPESVRIHAPELPYAYVSVDSTKINVEVDRRGATASFHGRVVSPTEDRLGHLTGTVLLPRFRRIGQSLAQQPIEGRVLARFEDIAVFAALVPPVDSLSGMLAAAAELHGTVQEPQVAGRLRLTHGAARLPDAGITLRDVTLTAAGAPDSATRIEGTVRSGDGWLRFNGEAGLSAGPRPIRLHLEGERFEAVNTPRVRAVVSPSLDVAVMRDSVWAEGELRLPVLRIVSPQSEGDADSIVHPVDDVVIVDSVPAAAGQPVAVAGRVRIVLGDSVHIVGRQLATRLGGSVLLSAEGPPPIDATGELLVHDGSFELPSGRILAIESGRVTLGGSPIADPGLLIQATPTEERRVLTGVLVEGEVRTPELALSGTRRLFELDVLAYLVLGQRLAAPYEGDEPTLTTEFDASLGPEGGYSSTRLVRRGLAWDRDRPEPRLDLVAPSFAAGEYLGPHLQASYATGTFGPESILRLRYFLSSTILLHGEEGRERQGDIFYRR